MNRLNRVIRWPAQNYPVGTFVVGLVALTASIYGGANAPEPMTLLRAVYAVVLGLGFACPATIALEYLDEDWWTYAVYLGAYALIAVATVAVLIEFVTLPDNVNNAGVSMKVLLSLSGAAFYSAVVMLGMVVLAAVVGGALVALDGYRDHTTEGQP